MMLLARGNLMNENLWNDRINNGEIDNLLEQMYGKDAVHLAKERYLQALTDFCRLFGDGCLHIISTPGRCEIAGNHTDHNSGIVVAASVNLDIIAVVKKTDDNIIELVSKGFETKDIINLSQLAQLSPHEHERGCSASLIRGICRAIKDSGGSIGGFRAYTTSNVLRGSGLSSSAAFEVCIGGIINTLYNNSQISPVQLAVFGQFAENNYFGKPSGLLDQTACAVGGALRIDFKDPAKPLIDPIDFKFMQSGLTLCITDTGGSHADLTNDYAAIPQEMKQVAGFFDKAVLREVDEQQIVQNINKLREQFGDRAVLRSLHFFAETERANSISTAIKENNTNKFLQLIAECGHSSFEYNQNAYCTADIRKQSIPLALAVSERILSGYGACRLQGGGFAGTIQAFVPNELVHNYTKEMDNIFGISACQKLTIRNIGVCEVY